MASKRILLLYITVHSGHHRAAMAVEKAIRHLDPSAELLSINSFNYTNPILERIINRTYMTVIKRTPEVWEYLYDNPKVVKNTQSLKDMIHKHNSSKMKALIEEFGPDVIACTQAFPCGMVADYKGSFNSDTPLMGILTDFYPHSYWIYEKVDRYTVASEEAKQKLIENGVSPDKIHILGIPVDITFRDKIEIDSSKERMGLSKEKITILIMGGSSGLGPIKKIVSALDRIGSNIQIVVVTGSNVKLYKYLLRHKAAFRKKVLILGYCENMNELMSICDMIVTKPGGLTVSEALAKTLPIIIINPIPGQEAKNTQFLLDKKAAIKAANEEELAILVDNLCRLPSKLEAMKKQAASLAKPDSAVNIARMILEIAQGANR